MTRANTFDRRSLVIGSVVAPVALFSALNAQTPLASPTTPSSVLPPGMLEPASSAPEYQTFVTHSTLQAPSATLDESCTLRVYPWARRTLSAVSVFMRAADVSRSPNSFLVQKLVYRDEKLAAGEFSFMSQEVVDVVAGMLIRQPQFAATDNPEANLRRFEYFEPNGHNYSLQVQLVGAEIHVVRTGGFGDFQWDFVGEMSDWLAATDLNSLQRLDEDKGWIVSYGPFQFHPDEYQAPDCFGP